MNKEIINRVEKSGIRQISLDDFYPNGERVLFDIKNLLFQEQVLIEKELRDFVKQNDWSFYQNKYVAIVCSADAIVPLWAFMLIASNIKPYAKKVVHGNLADLEKSIFMEIFKNHDFSIYKDESVILKGCGKKIIPESVIIDFAIRLQDVAKSVMFGEACSSVPIFKR